MKTSNHSDAILKKSVDFSSADLCVKCGICLPHCPTYNLTLDENESPRGRIALIQGSTRGFLKVNSGLLKHLDSCLMCRSCENVCPATVPYGQLLDGFRAEFGKGQPAFYYRLKSRIIGWTMRSKGRTQLLHRWLSFFRKFGLDAARNRPMLKRIFGVGDWSTMLLSISPMKGRSQRYPAKKREHGVIGLFTGCTGELLDGETIDAAISILSRLGYSVVIPQSQGCCGALDLHAGNAAKAKTLFRRNLMAFEDSRCDTIVSIASGCGAMLKEYSVHCDEHGGSAAFSSKVKDISQFIVACGGLDRLNFSPMDAKIYVHSPCSLRNVMHEQNGVADLLAAIPGISSIQQPKSINCCGAAGNYMIEHPKTSRALRDPILNSISRERPDYLVSSNIGCALHLRAGLIEMGVGIDVVHPVVLADRLCQ